MIELRLEEIKEVSQGVCEGSGGGKEREEHLNSGATQTTEILVFK